MVSLEPHTLDVERRPLGDKASGGVSGAAPNWQNHGSARLRRPLGPEPREQIAELFHETDATEGGDEYPLARVSLEDDGLLAVDPLTDSAPDLDGGEVSEWNPEILGFTRPAQD